VAALDEILDPERRIREVEPGLLSALGPDDEGAPYDTRAAAYDRLVSTPWYSNLAWGVPPETHTDFIRQALTASSEGWVVDVAAGSCVASAGAYPDTARPIVVLDRSLAMLRRGMDLVRRTCGGLPPHLTFLQADATALPFRDDTLATVLCHGALHVFPSPSDVCAEWARVLRPGGDLHVSSLVRGRWLGDRYLSLLHRAGEITKPRSAEEVAATLASLMGAHAELRPMGNFAYVSLRLPDPAAG
jgi:SAM-dependent methyltransferase